MVELPIPSNTACSWLKESVGQRDWRLANVEAALKRGVDPVERGGCGTLASAVVKPGLRVDLPNGVCEGVRLQNWRSSMSRS